MLHRLVEQGFLQRHGVGKGSYYDLSLERQQNSYAGLFDAITDADHPTFDMDHPTLDTDHPTLDTDHPTLDTDHPTLDADHPTLDTDHVWLESLNEADSNIIAQVSAHDRVDREVVERAILLVCRGRYCQLSEIARHLRRTPASLSNHYISRMLREGKLKQQFPEQPHHRYQAYTASQ